MKLKYACGGTLMFCLFAWQMAYGQTADEVSSLLSKSAIVKSKGPVRAAVSGSLISVSTYCGRSTSDQDCKITALLMMKEISHRYKNIHKLKVSFFDELNARQYRTVSVSAGDAMLIDSGKPVKDVLSVVDIAYGADKTKESWNSDGIQSYKVLPGYKEDDRALMLSSLKSLAKQGIDMSALWPQFMRIEDVIRSGGTEAIIPIYNRLNSQVILATARVNQEISSQNAAAKAEYDNAMEKFRAASSASARTVGGTAQLTVRNGSYYDRRLKIKDAIVAAGSRGELVRAFLQMERKVADNANIREIEEACKQLESHLRI